MRGKVDLDFAWLERELSKVKWSTFYMLRSCASIFDHPNPSEREVPPDYVRFIQRFGEAKLFRKLNSHSHFLTIVRPEWKETRYGERFVRVGAFWLEGAVYVKPGEGDLFVLHGGRPKVIAPSFAEWLTRRFRKCKAQYRKEDWEMLMVPPRPFSPEEQRIAAAHSHFRFEKAGVDNANGNALIKVSNDSNRLLHILFVGVIAKDRLKGAVQVDVSGLAPGESAVFSVDCYKSQVPAEVIELFSFPPPTDEDRAAFPEFRHVAREAKGTGQSRMEPPSVT